MSLKNEVNKTIDAVKDSVANVKDAAHEAVHRGAADAEQAKREVAGDEMTPGEKAGSMFKQAKNTVQADVDAAKRNVRSNT